MQVLDWFITLGFLILLATTAICITRFTRSVTDFLAAGRFAGRYMLTVAEGAAGLGAISIIASFEQHYIAGLCPIWWNWMFTAVQIGIALSGWVIYRFRQTRAMTMAQFFEMRYSRNFRIYAGIIAYISGVLNFAIFPAVGTRFFVYYCGLPETVSVFGFAITTYAVVMALLISISVVFTFGGMTAVMITDFIQGLFTYIVLAVIIVFLIGTFGWERLSQSLLAAERGKSFVNPMDIANVKDFNIWYFVIAMFAMIYGYKSWQGQQGYNCAAKTPHEARMGGILATWRNQFLVLMVAILPIVVYTFFHHPDFTEKASAVTLSLSAIENNQIREQMTVPMALAQILPSGLLGFFCAVMLCAFVGCNETYLHSWGSLFIQDVVLPFRKKELSPKQHLSLLRWSIIGVAVFTFFFSLWFTQTQYILLYFAITAAIYMGGAGACIIGGLYWKRGTTTAAWTSLIIGPSLAITGLAIRTMYPDFPINEQWMSFITIVACAVSYIFVSLIGKVQDFDMDKLLHRGKYCVAGDIADSLQNNVRGIKALGMTGEFSKADRLVYIGTMAWAIGWSIIFILVTVYALIFGIADKSWMIFWKIYIILGLIIGIVFALWFAIGGIRDIKYMLHQFRTKVHDTGDTGCITDSNLKKN
jgi:SSS family solute:Na+ symporter